MVWNTAKIQNSAKDVWIIAKTVSKTAKMVQNATKMIQNTAIDHS